jgi:rare lipoprotein A
MGRSTCPPMRYLLLFTALLAVAAAPPTAAQAPEAPAEVRAEERGHAARYPARPGGATASGETYNPERLTVAHATLPFGTLVELTNPRKGHTVTARVNDRDTGGALVRVSARAADRLGLPPGGAEVVIRLDSEEYALAEARRARLAARVEQESASQRDAITQRETPLEPLPPAAATGGRFTVQLGSFADPERARARAAEIPGAWVGPVDVAGQRMYRVNYGRYGSAEAARAEHERLVAQGLEGFVKGLEEVAPPVRPATLGDG